MSNFIILYMALTSAWSGGSLWPSQYLPKKLTWLPEAFFALGFVYALWPVIGWYSLIAGIWSYLWMQSGTGPALQWGDTLNIGKPRTLSPLANFISDKLGFVRGDINYCRLYMALKGILITLPVGGMGVILWPLGYDLGDRLGSNTYRELLAGAGAGISIILFRLLW